MHYDSSCTSNGLLTTIHSKHISQASASVQLVALSKNSFRKKDLGGSKLNRTWIWTGALACRRSRAIPMSSGRSPSRRTARAWRRHRTTGPSRSGPQRRPPACRRSILAEYAICYPSTQQDLCCILRLVLWFSMDQPLLSQKSTFQDRPHHSNLIIRVMALAKITSGSRMIQRSGYGCRLTTVRAVRRWRNLPLCQAVHQEGF